jgi:phage/plasmid primase-like uncharacterized protein
MTIPFTTRFLEAMKNSGIEPDCEIFADGIFRRFRDWRDKPGTKNCWYVLYPDFPPLGVFGCWKRGINEFLSDTQKRRHPDKWAQPVAFLRREKRETRR